MLNCIYYNEGYVHVLTYTAHLITHRAGEKHMSVTGGVGERVGKCGTDIVDPDPDPPSADKMAENTRGK